MSDARLNPTIAHHTDHLNTPRVVADAAGAIVWKWDQQEPFGDNVPDEDPSGLGAFNLPLRFAGQRHDRETGLHYNYYRDYDRTLGSYKQSDPIGLRGGLNTYAYVRLDPLSLIDPKGLSGVLMEKLNESLFELGIEIGIVSASPASKAGKSCGQQVCQSGGLLGTRSLNVEDLITDLCLKALDAAQSAAGIEVLTKCRGKCEEYIKKVCPSKTGMACSLR